MPEGQFSAAADGEQERGSEDSKSQTPEVAVAEWAAFVAHEKQVEEVLREPGPQT